MTGGNGMINAVKGKKKQIIKTTRLKETKRNILTLIFKVLMIYHSLRIHNIKQYLPKY